MQRFLLSSEDVAQALGNYLIDEGLLEAITEDHVLLYEQFDNNTTVATLYTIEEANEEHLL